MNILVLVKEVPDMEKVKFDSERGVVDRSSAEAEINPFDVNALQAAVDLKEKTGAAVTVVTMGPPKAERSLRDAYARGADHGVLLTDRKFGGSDTCATAKTLAAGIRSLGEYDLILCGEKSVDGDTAQVGAEVAEFLDIPHAYYVEEIRSLNETSVEVVIENLCGQKQVREMSLPALIGVTKNINTPKLPTVNRKLESLDAEMSTVTMAQLTGLLTEEETGFAGSPTKVSKIEVPGEKERVSKMFREDFGGFAKAVQSGFAAVGIRGEANR